MITETVFAKGWGILAARWKNDITPALQAVYFEQLDAELADDAFVAAVKRVVREQQFFPSIQQIIDAGTVPADDTGDAGRIFQDILDHPNYLPTRGSFFSLHTVQERWGIVAARAFQASGGERRWNAMADADIPFCLRDFTAGYRGAIGEQRARGQLEALGARVPPQLPSPEEARQLAAGARAHRLLDRVNEVREHFGIDPLAAPPKQNGAQRHAVEGIASIVPSAIPEAQP